MKFHVVLTAAAERDLAEIYGWYDAIDHRLTDRLDAELHRAFGFLEENPFLYAKIHGEKRRARLPTFRHLVIYEIHADEVVVIGIIHSARRPTVWQSRQ